MKSLGLLILALFGCASCRAVEDRASKFALQAGQSTAVMGIQTTPETMNMGGCQRPLGMGYTSCQLTKGAPMPNIQIFFSNPASFSVSDCGLGIYKSDSSKGGEVVTVDMSGLNSEIQAGGFCLIKVEVVEFYPDPNDHSQRRPIAMAGGFFTEVLDSDYQAVPPKDLTAWCYKVYRSTKGRTIVEDCDSVIDVCN